MDRLINDFDIMTWKYTILYTGVAVGFGYALYKWYTNSLRLIPGPRGLPILGITPYMDIKHFHVQLNEYAKEYGPVCRIDLLGESVILVTGKDAIDEVLSTKQNDFSDRLQTFRTSLAMNENEVTGFMNDTPEFREIKKQIYKSLKTYGDGMNKVENIMEEVLTDLMKDIRNEEKTSVNFSLKLQYTLTTVITSLIFAQRVHEKDIIRTIGLVDKTSKSFFNLSSILLDVMPWLRFFGNKAYQTLKSSRMSIDQTFDPTIEDLKNSIDENRIRNFVDSFYLNCEKSSLQLSHSLLANNVKGLIIAGYLTSSSILYTLLLLLMKHRDIEDKIVREIITYIGTNRLPKMEDREKMPYTEASILEALRYISNVPIALPHVAKNTSTISQFKIEKGTQIWVNLWGLHHSEEIWGDPFTFRPERFLAEDGSLLPLDSKLRKCLMAFGAGRRFCVGKNLAMHRIFLILTAVLQNFRLEIPNNTELVDLDCRKFEFGLVVAASAMPLKFIPRNL
ncbi:DgyrCDS2871 [Dimorphilus gyrociliatus]|uniref:DgyrCDS2871 n=1 Tax=Dimorphilus gyrociliatus TaxID=2664684 RepID=A0A7I8VGM8_9ANNE|nr:DgyrCDS2871 [Dimorphilus gyrociliatus]